MQVVVVQLKTTAVLTLAQVALAAVVQEVMRVLLALARQIQAAAVVQLEAAQRVRAVQA